MRQCGEPHCLSWNLERPLKANKTSNLIASTAVDTFVAIDVLVVNSNLGSKALRDLVIDRQTSAPCVAVTNEVIVSADIHRTEVLSAGGDGQLVRCLDGVLARARTR